MRWGLQGRIIAPVMLVTALAVALSAFLNYGKFLRTFTELEASRFAFIAGDIKTAIEGGLDLGVPLRGMATAQMVIDDEAARDRQIDGIILFSGAGKIVFHTGKIPYDGTVPAPWTAALADKASWTDVDGDLAIAGARLTNDIRQTVGGVAVLYSRRLREHILRAMAERLTLGAAISAIVTAALAYLGVSILVRRVRRDIGRVEAALEGDAADGAEPSAEARRTADVALREIAAVSSEFERLGGGSRP